MIDFIVGFVLECDRAYVCVIFIKTQFIYYFR